MSDRARAYEMLLDGRRPSEVATELGVSRATLRHWVAAPAFAWARAWRLARWRAQLASKAAQQTSKNRP